MLDFVKIYSNKHDPSVNNSKTFNIINKLYLITFTLISIYITHITQPLLSFKAVRSASVDVQVQAIKGELKCLISSNMWSSKFARALFIRSY